MHLDVKPRNLFLVGDHVKVADFGLAKHLERLSATGIMAGISPQYAAPETFASRLTRFSDQYSLAIVYPELLVGRRPFTGKTIRELALQHMNVEPDLCGCPSGTGGPWPGPWPRTRTSVPQLQGLHRGAAARAEQPRRRTGPGRQPDPDGPAGRGHGPERVRLGPPDAAVRRRGRAQDGRGPAGRAGRGGRAHRADGRAVRRGRRRAPGAPGSRTASGSTSTSRRPTAAVLRPTLVIGIGGFGLLALRKLRSRLTDRMGDLRQTPAGPVPVPGHGPGGPDGRGQPGRRTGPSGPEQVFPTPLAPGHPVPRARPWTS